MRIVRRNQDPHDTAIRSDGSASSVSADKVDKASAFEQAVTGPRRERAPAGTSAAAPFQVLDRRRFS